VAEHHPGEEKGIGKFKTSQASDVGSIPIARSINPVDAVGFTGFPLQLGFRDGND